MAILNDDYVSYVSFDGKTVFTENLLQVPPTKKTAKQLRKQRQDDQEAKSFNEKVLKTISRSRLSKFLKK